MLPGGSGTQHRALLVALCILLLGTGAVPLAAPRPARGDSAPHAICGRPALHDAEAELARSFTPRQLTKEEMRAQGKLDAEGSLQADYVGQQRSFWAYSWVTYSYYQLTATCRRVGTHAYLYVENGRYPSDAALTRIIDEFDNTMYPRNTAAFGSEPNPGIDGDARVYLLLLDIRDSFESTGYYIAGYFTSLNEYANADLPRYLRYSNEKEMLYIDLYPSQPGDSASLGTIAHEFQHMIHWWMDPNHEEETWVDEGCADLAEFLCGYGYPVSHLVTGSTQQPGFLEEPDHQLTLTGTAWDSTSHILASYGASFMWTLYLWDHYGGDALIRRLVREGADGIQGVNNALSATGASDRFEQVFRKWVVANYIDDDTGPYGYPSIVLVESGANRVTTFPRARLAASYTHYPVGPVRTTVNYWAADAIKLTGGSGETLQITFAGDDDNRFAALLVRSSSSSLAPGTNLVSEITLDSRWDGSESVPGLGTSTTTTLLIPASLGQRGSRYYSFSALLEPILSTPSPTLFSTATATPSATLLPTATETPSATPTHTVTHETPSATATATPTATAAPPTSSPTSIFCPYPPCATATPTGTASAALTWLPILLNERPQPTVTPTATPPAAAGIYGRVTRNGAPAPDVRLELCLWDGQVCSICATTRTFDDGRYDLAGVPDLAEGYEYYVRYLNVPGDPNPGPGCLRFWIGNRIGAYNTGTAVAGGDFDIGDVTLTSPAPAAPMALPVPFRWVPRNVPNDNYVLALYRPAGNAWWSSDPLGYVSEVEIGGFPAGWPYGETYLWAVHIHQGHDPGATPYNYGGSYDLREMIITGRVIGPTP